MAVQQVDGLESLVVALPARSVAALQEALRQTKRADLEPDGIAGPRTLAALRRLRDEEPWTAETLDSLDPEQAFALAGLLRSVPSPQPRPALKATRATSKPSPRPKPKPTPIPRPPAPSSPVPTPYPSAHAPAVRDAPANEDRLERIAFAWTLAMRIRAAHEEVGQRPAGPSCDGPFLVHLHGAWGSGKSTLLEFLAQALRTPTSKRFARFTERLRRAGTNPDELRPWAIVRFNAWRHQRIAPPWWWLMAAVYQQAARDMPFHRRIAFRLKDWRRRVWSAWPAYAVFAGGAFACASLLWLGWGSGLFQHTADRSWLEVAGGVATSLAAVATLAITAWGGLRGASRWVMMASARGADAALARSHDPFGALRTRYRELVESLDRPLVVFIDDLDRCDADYVVKLLEGVQTLFADAAVTYVVAGDRRWICDSYDQVYSGFAPHMGRPGRPLGYHFLEKTFQLSAGVPELSESLRRRYWRSVLGLDESLDEETLAAERERAEREAASAGDEEELLAGLRKVADAPAARVQAVSEAVASRLEDEDVRRRTEHRLRDYDHLLERNPRAIKRLANAYGFERQLQLLEGNAGPSVGHLALWTILTLRWPRLGEYLAANPRAVTAIRENKPAPNDAPEDIMELFHAAEVRRVVTGRGVPESLTITAVEAAAR
jgi:hypothetical protein